MHPNAKLEEMIELLQNMLACMSIYFDVDELSGLILRDRSTRLPWVLAESTYSVGNPILSRQSYQPFDLAEIGIRYLECQLRTIWDSD